MTPVRDRLEAVLSRLAARAARETVFTRVYAETARQAADAADRRRSEGRPLGPLDGRIVSVKDLFDVAGDPTLAGSVIRRTAAPAAADAPVVARLRQAGAVVLGKTAMTEFAFTAIGDNPHTGTPPNAADPARIPGGSSSGAGVSAAEGTSDIAIGSDTGGSVRIPAALNGVVGFKPTAGRVPLDGAFPLSFTLDSIGPLARSVADCAAADAVMAGEPAMPPEDVALAGLAVAVPRGRLLEAMDEAVAIAFAQSLRRLEAAGMRLHEIEIDDLLDAMRALTRKASIAAMEGAEVHAEWLASGASAAVDPRVAGSLSRAGAVPAPFYIRAVRRRPLLARAMDERLSPFAALALPTVPLLAPAIATVAANADYRDHVEGLLLRNTQVANQFDLCALSLPMPGTALPSGLMLVGGHGHDRRLLALGQAVERLLGAAG